MKEYFKGYYLKHQKDGETLCLIVGRTASECFIQVVTPDFSRKVLLKKGNSFSGKGITVDIREDGLTLTGSIRYGKLSTIAYDIMGPFALFPMECRHGIISMRHRLQGAVTLNGRVIDFSGGIGYIEMDRGYSFPDSYIWVHANDFEEPCSVMAAVADIPFCGIHFRGCICVIQYHGREYRLATYLGVRVLECTRRRIVLRQGKYRLDIRIAEDDISGIVQENTEVHGSGQSAARKKGQRVDGHVLSAPRNGKMTRDIVESVSRHVEFIFYIRNKKLFHLSSENAGFECEQR